MGAEGERRETGGSERAPRFALAAIVALGAALRFCDLGAHSVWLDELITIHAMESLEKAALQTLHPPLHYTLLWGWANLFGESVASLRGFSAFAGTLTVFVGHRVARELFQREGPALLCALLFAVLPVHLHFAREARMYSLWMLLMLVCAWGALRFFRAQRIERRALALYLAGLIGAQLTHHYTLFYAAFFALGVLVLLGEEPLRKTRRDVTNWLWIHASVLLGAVLVLCVFVLTRGSLAEALEQTNHGLHRGGYSFELIQAAHLVWFRDWAHRENSEMLGVLAAVAAGLMLVASMAMWKDRSVGGKRALWFALASFPPFALIEWLPVRDYTRLLFPSAALLTLGLGYCAWLPVRAWGRRGWLVCAAMVAFFGWTLRGEVAGVYADEIEPWNEVCRHIEARETETEIIFVTARHMAGPFEFCYRGNARVVPFADAEEVLRESKGRDRVWLIYSHAWNERNSDPSRQALRQMRKSFQVKARLEPGPVITVYELEHRRPSGE